MNKTITDELERLHLPDPIRATANEIYKKLSGDTGTRRCTVRRTLIFFCVNNAYIENGEIRDPVEIAKLCGVSPSVISHANKHFSFPRTCYRPKYIHVLPIDLLPQYARTLGLREDIIPSLVELCSKWTDSPEMKKMMPQPVAAAFLRYYMELQGMPVNIDTFLETFNLTRLALDQAYTKVVEMDNG